MRKLRRVVAIVLSVLIGLAGLALAGVYLATSPRLNRTYVVERRPLRIPTSDEAAERGRHLARIYMCHECHGSNLAGKMFADIPFTAFLPAPNLTRGRGGAAARYTPADWARAVLHGLHQDGRPLVFMPSHQLRRMSDDDLGAIVSFIERLPAVDREWSPALVKPLGRVMMVATNQALLPAELIDHGATRAIPPAPAATAAYGEHLATTAGCRACHRSDLSGGAGPPPGGANLTPEGDVKGWTEHDFMRAMRTGTRPDGTILASTMPRDFSEMTDLELRAIWLYLQSLPSKQG